MKTIINFVKSVFQALCAFCFGVGILYTALVIFTSGYEYRLVENKVMRAWHVQLPGYHPYLDLNSKPPVWRQRFIMRSFYRVGPWLAPEFPQNEEPSAKP